MIKIKKVEVQCDNRDNRIYLSNGDIINFEFHKFGSKDAIDCQVDVFDKDWNRTNEIYIVRNYDLDENSKVKCSYTLKDLLNNEAGKRRCEISEKQYFKPNKETIFRKVVDYLYN